MTIETIISICLGIGLAASVGFRVFLPLFVLSLASYFNVWQLNESWEWVGSITALITLGVATLIEICAYYIPYVDNLLDSIAVPLAALAGTTVMLSTVADLSPVITWSLAIIAGGGTAAVITGSTSTARLASTATSGGLANPIVTTIETGVSIVMAIVSVFLPLIAIILVLFIFLIIFFTFKKFKSSKLKKQ
ncbi:DUF4126 domain-containing protein [Hyunsoonleella aestuarii]|uniref:DUF4126 domain-containing protein n=1 Tax=Hyunsoonleella aestuarii TaxID=912802 RepID=A0ABP8EDJ2_9FLAO|nr:DUF4126 domain-containing protein [Hyunsoonleella aestuarii]